MSLYNLVNGFNTDCILILPMLGRKPEEYPRFRDCYISNDKKYIDIYTRVGGNNRNCGMGEEELYKDENFVETFDDDFDSTYGTYRFKVPAKWKNDFDMIIKGKLKNVSNEYMEYVKVFYPLLAEKGVIDKLFCRENDMQR